MGSKRDDLSLALGLVSVLGWGVAEVPQIITNFKTKSAEGLSIFFLLTWILGDFLNLFGCILEPATLPTQYYTAMLYLVTTLILSAQAFYYRHIYPRMKSSSRMQEALQDDTARCPTDENDGVDAARFKFTPTSPIPLSHCSPSASTPIGDLYFMSARSLSVSNTPPIGSFAIPRTPPPSDIERSSLTQPLINDVRTPKSTSPIQIKAMLCVVGLMFFVGISKKKPVEYQMNKLIITTPTRAIVLQGGRQLLEAKPVSATRSGLGSILGWGMAFIYLGGRLPQICLNIKRGNTEGLNPLMFTFALVANSTYVASILLKSTEWSKVQPNLPWLVDSGGCVFLDTFILIQFLYYRYRSRNEVDKYVS